MSRYRVVHISQSPSNPACFNRTSLPQASYKSSINVTILPKTKKNPKKYMKIFSDVCFCFALIYYFISRSYIYEQKQEQWIWSAPAHLFTKFFPFLYLCRSHNKINPVTIGWHTRCNVWITFQSAGVLSPWHHAYQEETTFLAANKGSAWIALKKQKKSFYWWRNTCP